METIRTGEEAIARLRERAWSSITPGLSRTRTLLERLGSPEKCLKFVHITGTNGKGSTAAMLASVLRAAGFRTGLFTSPHLYRFHERMQVNGEMIPDELLISLSEKVLAASEDMSENPTEFDLMTSLGMLYFDAMHCDIVVLEVGLGGFLDSTNVIPAPEVAVITNIGLEHTAILGDTIEKIAHEKSGIIKSGCRAVLYCQSKEAEDVIRARCESEGAELTITAPDMLNVSSSTLDGQTFTYRGRAYRLALLGNYQVQNALTALDTVEALRARGWNISEDALCRGLSTVSWPGRLELVHRAPDFLIDGGHNPQCADALMRSLRDLLGERKVVFLVGVLGDKDWEQMLSAAFPMAQAFVTLTPQVSRAKDGAELAAWLVQHGFAAQYAPTLEDGVAQALALAGADGVICSFGSLYSVGDLRHYFKLC